MVLCFREVEEESKKQETRGSFLIGHRKKTEMGIKHLENKKGPECIISIVLHRRHFKGLKVVEVMFVLCYYIHFINIIVYILMILYIIFICKILLLFIKNK